MDLTWALRLQAEWGADEALLDAPQDRRVAAKPAVEPPPRVAARAAAPAAGPAETARIANGCDTLEALEQALAGFAGCALRDTATRLVFADGAADAPLMLAGDAPGAEEDRAGRPFVGPAGQLLDRMLGSIGLDRARVRMTNVLPWRPPGNRPATEAEVALCLPFLLRHIALVRPRMLLLLGGPATKAVLPEPERQLGIRRLRGVMREVPIAGLQAPLPCLASYHPAYLHEVSSAKAEAWQDLLKLREFAENW